MSGVPLVSPCSCTAQHPTGQHVIDRNFQIDNPEASRYWLQCPRCGRRGTAAATEQAAVELWNENIAG